MVQFPRNLGGVYPPVKSQNDGLPQIVSEFSPLVKQHGTWNPSHLKRDTSWNDAFVHYVSLPQCISVKALVKKTSSNTTPTTTLALWFFSTKQRWHDAGQSCYDDVAAFEANLWREQNSERGPALQRLCFWNGCKTSGWLEQWWMHI